MWESPIDELPPDRVRLVEDGAYGPAIALTAGGAHATVALQGAQLLGWRPANSAEVIWLSPETRRAEGKSLRGGTPICWPWFGQHPDGGGRPAHGFARGAPWRVHHTGADEHTSMVALSFKTGPEHETLWPHDAEAMLVVTLGADAIDLELRTSNTGREPFELTQALHTYFAVGDIARTRVLGLEGCDYIDTLGTWTRRHENGPVSFGGEVDRIYLATPAMIEIDDVANARRIAIESRGSRSAVVWNPWIEKSARLGDMGPEGYRRMVCVETANAADDAVTIMPGSHHQIAATYRVRSSG